jgi:hypothetical protein
MKSKRYVDETGTKPAEYPLGIHINNTAIPNIPVDGIVLYVDSDGALSSKTPSGTTAVLKGMTKFIKSFLTSDWSHVGNTYELDILATEHAVGTSPYVQIYLHSGGNYELVLNEVMVDGTGNIKLLLPFDAVTDLRYDGKIVIV